MNKLSLLLLLFVACAQTPNPAPVQSETSNLPTVTFPDGYVVRVEVAANDELRQQGLMYRDRLREAHGMIFVFARSDVYPFWMKNTLIPLDMVWIGDDRRIAHVKTNVPPCQADPCPSYDPQVPARYVLEVAGGVAGQHHLKAGDQLRFEGLDAMVVR